MTHISSQSQFSSCVLIASSSAPPRLALKRPAAPRMQERRPRDPLRGGGETGGVVEVERLDGRRRAERRVERRVRRRAAHPGRGDAAKSPHIARYGTRPKRCRGEHSGEEGSGVGDARDGAVDAVEKGVEALRAAGRLWLHEHHIGLQLACAQVSVRGAQPIDEPKSLGVDPQPRLASAHLPRVEDGAVARDVRDEGVVHDLQIFLKLLQPLGRVRRKDVDGTLVLTRRALHHLDALMVEELVHVGHACDHADRADYGEGRCEDAMRGACEHVTA
mmetsp:Transcript_9201/g.29149  ORF Transcript_9201/g.29149 Transcript_9201/m.29149 type:complete len:275 (+) Transcript_9201:209-1033(+)